jgi:hypothetical protein
LGKWGQFGEWERWVTWLKFMSWASIDRFGFGNLNKGGVCGNWNWGRQSRGKYRCRKSKDSENLVRVHVRKLFCDEKDPKE